MGLRFIASHHDSCPNGNPMLPPLAHPRPPNRLLGAHKEDSPAQGVIPAWGNDIRAHCPRLQASAAPRLLQTGLPENTAKTPLKVAVAMVSGLPSVRLPPRPTGGSTMKGAIDRGLLLPPFKWSLWAVASVLEMVTIDPGMRHPLCSPDLYNIASQPKMPGTVGVTMQSSPRIILMSRTRTASRQTRIHFPTPSSYPKTRPTLRTIPEVRQAARSTFANALLPEPRNYTRRPSTYRLPQTNLLAGALRYPGTVRHMSMQLLQNYHRKAVQLSLRYRPRPQLLAPATPKCQTLAGPTNWRATTLRQDRSVECLGSPASREPRRKTHTLAHQIGRGTAADHEIPRRPGMVRRAITPWMKLGISSASLRRLLLRSHKEALQKTAGVREPKRNRAQIGSPKRHSTVSGGTSIKIIHRPPSQATRSQLLVSRIFSDPRLPRFQQCPERRAGIQSPLALKPTIISLQREGLGRAVRTLHREPRNGVERQNRDVQEALDSVPPLRFHLRLHSIEVNCNEDRARR